MNDRRPPARRPGKQAGEFAARLQHSREVMDRRRTIEREREHGVADAVRDYWLAWRAISAIERRRDRRVHALEEKIRRITDTADSDIDVHRQEQATAVVRLTEHGCSTDDVADLLEISLRTARGLLSSGRALSNPPEEQKQIPRS